MKKLFLAATILAATLMASCQESVDFADGDNRKYYCESHMAAFDFDCLEDLIWSPDDGIFYLEYSDPDAFDLDYLAEQTGRSSWYGDYIHLDIDDTLVPILQWDWEQYLDLEDNPFKQGLLQEEYYIEVTWFYFDDGSQDVMFELRKNIK